MKKLNQFLNYLRNPKPEIKKIVPEESTLPEPNEHNSMFHQVTIDSIVHNYLFDSECKVMDQSKTLKGFVVKETHVEDNRFYVRGFFLEDENSDEMGKAPIGPKWYPQEDVYINIFW